MRDLCEEVFCAHRSRAQSSEKIVSGRRAQDARFDSVDIRKMNKCTAHTWPGCASDASLVRLLLSASMSSSLHVCVCQ